MPNGIGTNHPAVQLALVERDLPLLHGKIGEVDANIGVLEEEIRKLTDQQEVHRDEIAADHTIYDRDALGEGITTLDKQKDMIRGVIAKERQTQDRFRFQIKELLEKQATLTAIVHDQSEAATA